jgi:hypothetical protein
MIMRCGVERRVNSNEGKWKLGKNWSLVVERLVVTIALKGLSAAVWNSVRGHGGMERCELTGAARADAVGACVG